MRGRDGDVVRQGSGAWILDGFWSVATVLSESAGLGHRWIDLLRDER